VNRRRFLLRGLAGALGLSFARWAAAQGVALPDTAGARPDSTRAAEGGPARVTLVAGGDTTLGYNLQDHFDQQVAAGVPKDRLWPLYFSGMRPLFESADVAIVNLECPFTERGKKLKKNFNFRARPELVRVLQEGSVDVASLANNHTADFGRHGVQDTMRTLDQAGIARFGAGMNLEQARRPAVVERNGVKVGFLGYYFQADPDMIEPEQVYATRRRAGVAGCYKDLACVKRQVADDVRELVRRVDAVVPYFHWGKEGSYEVRDYQIELAHLCVDLGCRAVLGAHPHRVQGVELYRGVPIYYSLGNFVYGGIKEPKDLLTLVARFSISAQGTEAGLEPVQFTRWPEAPFQPFVLAGPAREEAMARIASYSAGFERTLPALEPYRGASAGAPADSAGTR
jgi:poly-gamma-glutamate synthesis protein (capsule biosynthesis protein)